MQLTDYEVLCIIGSGSFGVCYKVKHKKNNQVYVWKAIDYGCMSEDQKQLLVSEVNLLKELKHPNIVQYYDRIIHAQTQILYIIMEFCEQGDLAKLITKCKDTNSCIEERFVWKVLYQTARALQACHTHKSRLTILHRDIKPANIFLDSRGNVKLGDFGLARIMDKDSFSDTVVGTPNYMSPEVIKGAKYNKKSDVWSLGCLVYELCALQPPFFSDTFVSLSDNIKQGRFKKIPKDYTDDLHNVIKLLLNTDCTYRPSVEIIIHHPTVLSNLSTEFTSPIVKNIKRTSLLDKLNNCDNVYQNDLHLHQQKTVSKSDSDPKTLAKALETFKSPHDLTEDTFKQVWLTKLEQIRQREVNLKQAEAKLLEKEKLLAKREQRLEQLNVLAKEKLAKAEALIKTYKTGKCLRPRRRAQKIDYLDLDSTLSADTGDCESIIVPAVKLEPIKETILKPDVQILNDKLNNKPVKKNLFSVFKTQKQTQVDDGKTKQQKLNKENKDKEDNKENFLPSSVWNADNKRAAFELLALLNAKSQDDLNINRMHTSKSARNDCRRKSMIVLKKSTVL